VLASGLLQWPVGPFQLSFFPGSNPDHNGFNNKLTPFSSPSICITSVVSLTLPVTNLAPDHLI